MKRDPKSHLGASNSTRYSSYGRVVSVFNGKYMGPTKKKKKAISRDFLHFFNFDVILKGEPRGIQKLKRDLPNSCGTRDMAAESFNFIGKHERGLIKNCDFLNLRFSDLLKDQNSPQEGPKVPKWTQEDTFSAYYKALV